MIAIVPYEDRWFEQWRALSMDWLREYDLLEPADLHLLDHPRETALDPGGAIYLAVEDDVPVGTASLLPAGDSVWEIVKLTVRRDRRGRGIADRLMAAALEGVRARGGHTALLFTNSRLEAAIGLYRKWGFLETAHRGSNYCESDRRFEKTL